MTWTGRAPARRTYQTPSPGCANGAPEVTHIPPAGSKATFVANGMPAATSCPGAAGGAAAPAGAAVSVAAAAARTVRTAMHTRRATVRA